MKKSIYLPLINTHIELDKEWTDSSVGRTQHFVKKSF
jgi:hypothetical protein